MSDEVNPQRREIRIDRRTVLSLLGLAAAAVAADACSSDASTSPTASAASPGSPLSTIAPTTPASSTSVSAAGTSVSAAGTSTTEIGTSTSGPGSTTSIADTTTSVVETTTSGVETSTSSTVVTGAVRALTFPAMVDTARLQDLSDSYAGDWYAAWSEDTGDSGTLHATVVFDVGARTISTTFSYTGPFLHGGAGAPDSFMLTVPDGETPERVDTETSVIGDAVYTYEGGTSASLAAAMLPGGDFSLAGDASLLGSEINVSYQLTSPDGQVIYGSADVLRGSMPAPIDPTTIRDSAVLASITSGQYACQFITSDEVASAFGEPVGAVESNGGNLLYAPGLQSTNCRAQSVSGDAVAQLTILRADDVPTAQAYWTNAVKQNQKSVPGFGDDAVFLAGTAYMLVGKFIAESNVVGLIDGPPPFNIPIVSFAIAKFMEPRLRTTN